MQTLLVLAILSFTRPISAGCGNYQYPDNINKQDCESGGVGYSCADGLVMNIVATCYNDDKWENVPTCVAPVVPVAPVDVDSVDENPVDVDSVDENPVDVDSVDENPVDVDSVDENPVDVDSVDENPVDVDSVDENPVDVDSVDENPVDVDSVDENPVDVDSVDENPVDVGLVDVDPVDAVLPVVPECTTELDVVFVIDGSSSVGSTDFDRMITILTDALPSMNIGPDSVNVAAVVYSQKVYGKIGLDSDLSRLQNEFETLTYPTRGGTRTDKGIKEGGKIIRSQGRDGVQGIMVVITDGESNNPRKTKRVAKKVRKNGIEIYAVGIGNADQTELNGIASSSENVFQLDDFDAFESDLNSIIDAFCTK